MTVLAFNRPILLMRVRARNTMSNSKGMKECVMNFLMSPTPIRLDTLDFSIYEALNMSLELQKYTRSLRTIMHQIDPRKFIEIINEANIIFKTLNIWRCRAPNIRKTQFQR